MAVARTYGQQRSVATTPLLPIAASHRSECGDTGSSSEPFLCQTVPALNHHGRTASMTSLDNEQLASMLSASPDYKVLVRLKPRKEFAPSLGRSLAKGVVVDTETTSLDPDTGKIIEVGLITFEFDASSGQIIHVLDSYGGLEDPGHALSEETTTITGITSAMVAGQHIDDAKVASMMAGAQLVVAHNAEFDRPFLENRLPVFKEVPWGCSLVDIHWSAENIGARKLDYIAFKMGFFFEAHRALEDCQALLEILGRPLPVSGKPALKPVFDQLAHTEYVLYALNSPFASKDSLKARRYRWNADSKVWAISVAGTQACHEELAWLKATIYNGRSVPIDIEERTALNRFSRRICPRSRQTL